MDPSSSFSLYLGSVLLGLSVAAPIGPINVEIIRRGLTQSARSAFALGCGAVTADCCYFGLALAGASLASRVGESGVARVGGLAVGGAMLGWLGIGALRKTSAIQGPGATVEAAVRSAGGGNRGEGGVGDAAAMFRTWLLGLGLTLANPMTIALWLSIAAGFAAAGGGGGGVGASALRVMGVFSGALSWVCFVTALTAWARRWINPLLMRAVQLISGAILLGYGVWFLTRIFLTK